MIETDREQANGIIPGSVLVSALLREAELWTNAQSEVLSFAEAANAGRMDRWREAVENWSRSLQRLCDCRNAVDCVRTMEDWLRDAVRLATSDMRALVHDSRIWSRWTSAGFKALGATPKGIKMLEGQTMKGPKRAAAGSRSASQPSESPRRYR
jgi:hypothetical protein